jgi:inosose dehydratase
MTDRKLADAGTHDPRSLRTKLAGAPITWGICEVPGWGLQLSAERVLSEMRSLGLRATEAGAEGFLPANGHELRRVLSEADLDLVGGFVPVVLHDRTAREQSLAGARAEATRFAAAGGSVLVSAVVVDDAWSPRAPLAGDDWRRIFDGLERLDAICAEHGIAHVLHPHVGTLVETRDDVARVVDGSGVSLCVDTGHFEIGGVDSLSLVHDAPYRIGHVHLKDVRESVAAELRNGRMSLLEATRRGLFVPLGEGDAPVADVVRALDATRYEGWYVLEQDTVIEDSAGAATADDDMRRSIDFLRTLGAGHDLAAAPGAGGR